DFAYFVQRDTRCPAQLQQGAHLDNGKLVADGHRVSVPEVGHSEDAHRVEPFRHAGPIPQTSMTGRRRSTWSRVSTGTRSQTHTPLSAATFCAASLASSPGFSL